jgi:D-aminopeptidase
VRARELGIAIGRSATGTNNAITDVPGIRVGHVTLIEGEGPLRPGHGPVRTGVTVVVPHEGHVWSEPVFAGVHQLNGNGEMTGTAWIEESGMLTSVVALTNTHSVGVVRDALVAEAMRASGAGEVLWALPVVAETWDGLLNDVNGQHVRSEHVRQALESASDGPVPEGNVGGGTGMICHGFKGGIGTSSRLVPLPDLVVTVGVLVQANHGRRKRLRVDGVPVGELIPPSEIPLPEPPSGSGQASGSIIGVVATDAPLLPLQCRRLAQRAGLGVARVGGVGEHWSGDLFLAFATGNRGLMASHWGSSPPVVSQVRMLSDAYMSELFVAVVDATEEAILNALLEAETMSGRDGIVAYALDPARLADIMARYRGYEAHQGKPV